MYQHLQKQRFGEHVPTLLFLCLFFFFIGFAIVFGAGPQYTPLVGIPELRSAQGSGLAGYLNRIYVVLIALGAMVAFVKISIAGAKYSMSGIITDKSSAKEDIKGSLLGLAILLIPFIVLNTIYPGLTSLDILKGAGGTKIDLKAVQQGSSQTTTSGGAGTSEAGSFTASTVYRDCAYDRILVSSVTDELTAADATYTYDSTKCRAACTAENGTFTETGIDTGQCAFVEATPSSSASCELGGPCG